MTSILTFTGKRLDYLNPLPEMIMIEDIARGLSCESRFNGQTSTPYFVAQHCYLCSQIVDRQLALEALLHDATEAYMKDIPTPLKRLLPKYMEMERQLDIVIRRAFQLPEDMSLKVKHADQDALKLEMLNFTNHPKPDGIRFDILRPWGSDEAFEMFMERFEDLRGD